MAGVLIVIILSFLFFFILTRKVWVRVIKEENFRLQFHLPLLSLHLTKRKKQESDKKDQSSKSKTRLGIRSYFRIVTSTLDHVENCEITVKQVILPCKTGNFSASTLVSPFGYQGLIYTVIAYLKTKTKNLVLEDNAIISSPDVTETQFYLTVKLRLYQLIYALLTLKIGINKEERKRV